jgi:hypothetical protein
MTGPLTDTLSAPARGIGTPPRPARTSPRVMRNPSIRFAGSISSLPRISIVTPCLNHARYVEATLCSVIEQGYPNLDCIVLDGGSTDGSRQIVEQYADYLSHWESGPDAGQYHAIARGFARSDGEIMMWLNSDDMLARNALWTIAEVFSQLPDVEWLHGRPGHIDDTGRWHMPDPPPRWSRLRFLLGDYRWIQQESVAWRRTLWERAGGRLNTDYSLATDMELWMRFFRHARLHTTTAPLAGFRHTPGQRSHVCEAEYVEQSERIVASEPWSALERVAIARARRLQRLRRRPLLWRSRRLAAAYERLFDFPPTIDFDHASGRFVPRGIGREGPAS